MSRGQSLNLSSRHARLSRQGTPLTQGNTQTVRLMKGAPAFATTCPIALASVFR